MINPNLLLDQTNKCSINMKFPNDAKASESLHAENNIVSKNSKLDLSVSTKTNSDIKRYENTHGFSFPKLNDSPSHIINHIQENSDSLDDEFTEFQSADFNTVSKSQEVENNLNSIIDEEEFTNFQNASPIYNGDDLSVLVIGGKHIPSAQQLWVTDKPTLSSIKGDETREILNTSLNLHSNDKIAPKNHAADEAKCNIEMKYDAFQEMEDDKYSVFHNPLPDEEHKQNAMKDILGESMQMETKSIFQHSLFEDPEPALDLFKSNVQSSNIDLTNFQLTHSKNDIKENEDEDDDEFSNFQNFPVTFPEDSSTVPSENIDKYDVFRTIVFENTSCQQENTFQQMKMHEDLISNAETLSQIQQFELAADDYQKGEQYNKFSDNSETKSVDSINFCDLQKQVVLPSGEETNIDSLLSSLVITEKNNKIENNSELTSESAEDKYKALRLLEPSNDECDDFGEFLGAELPNSENDPRKSKDVPSIQVSQPSFPSKGYKVYL